MASYLIAHDLGTTGNKATLFTAEGKLQKSVVYPYGAHFFNGSWAEQNPADWWRAVCDSTRELVAEIAPGDVAALSFSGQMMGCVCVDRQGEPVREAIIWADQRAVQQAQQLRGQMDEAAFYRITGHKISASYTLEKLMWLRDNEPESFDKTHCVLQPKDYIVYRLTGELATDYSDASGTNAFDINTMQWSDEILGCAGIRKDIFPQAYPSTHVAGRLAEGASAACGLLAGTPVVVGGGDGVCAAVGAASVSQGQTYNYLGSSSWVAFSSSKPVFDPGMRTFNFVHMVPGLYMPIGTMQAAGNSLSFMKNTLCGDLVQAAKEQGVSPYALMDEEIELSSPGANGLLFLPYLLGERSPRWNSDARGAFVGMKMEHKRRDLLRATIEGVAMNLVIILDILQQGKPAESIHLLGGLAQGEIICEILASVFGCKVRRLNYLEEATSMGAAIAAGVGVGLFGSFDAIRRFVDIEKEIDPNPQWMQSYDAYKRVFEDAYRALEPVYRELAQL